MLSYFYRLFGSSRNMFVFSLMSHYVVNNSHYLVFIIL